MTIAFDRKFYDLDAIKISARAYKELAKFSFKSKKGIILVEAVNIDKDVEGVFKDEFCNYVLSETKKMKSHGA